MILQLKAINKEIKSQFNIVASKSETNRLLIIKALCNKEIKLNNVSNSDDSDILSNILSNIKDKEICDVGIAGTVMRFMTALCAVTQGERLLTGHSRMLERPIGILVKALRDLGANIEYVGQEGYPPILIKGKTLEGGRIKIDGSVSSQFITALLLIAPILSKGLTIEFTSTPVSFPYINLTLELMKTFGAKYDWLNKNILEIKPTGYESTEYTVDADWSSISYWYAIASLAKSADIKIMGVKSYNLQGDAIIKNFYETLGVVSLQKDNYLQLIKKQTLLPKSVYFNFIESPDIAQTIIFNCAALQIGGTFTGLTTLRIKETDRILALQNELKKIGAYLDEIESNHFTLRYEKYFVPTKDILFNTYNDHRMAMATAPLALIYDNVLIEAPNVVSKSYPSFWNDLLCASFSLKTHIK